MQTDRETIEGGRSPRIGIRSLLHSLGVVAYVAAVATLMENANAMFGTVDTVLTAVAFLLLFSISAAIVGSLVFGYPVVLFLGGQKREGVRMAVMTIAWLVIETAMVLGVLMWLK